MFERNYLVGQLSLTQNSIAEQASTLKEPEAKKTNTKMGAKHVIKKAQLNSL